MKTDRWRPFLEAANAAEERAWQYYGHVFHMGYGGERLAQAERMYDRAVAHRMRVQKLANLLKPLDK